MTGGEAGSVLTWPSHAVGAVVYPNAHAACIQSAQSAKSRSSSGAGGVALESPEKSEISLNLAQAISEAVMALQDKNDVATFADVSLFQICTIAANNRLTADQTIDLVKSVMLASVEIAKARPLVSKTVTTISSPAPEPEGGDRATERKVIEKSEEKDAKPEDKAKPESEPKP